MGLPGAKPYQGSWLIVCPFQHLWRESVCKAIIFHIVNPAMGMLLILQGNNKNNEVTKQRCSNNPWSQQTAAWANQGTSSVWAEGNARSPWGTPDSDCLSVKIKQTDRKQLTSIHFTLYTPPENVKCHHLRERIFMCDPMRVCVFTCT